MPQSHGSGLEPSVRVNQWSPRSPSNNSQKVPEFESPPLHTVRQSASRLTNGCNCTKVTTRDQRRRVRRCVACCDIGRMNKKCVPQNPRLYHLPSEMVKVEFPYHFSVDFPRFVI